MSAGLRSGRHLESEQTRHGNPRRFIQLGFRSNDVLDLNGYELYAPINNTASGLAGHPTGRAGQNEWASGIGFAVWALLRMKPLFATTKSTRGSSFI